MGRHARTIVAGLLALQLGLPAQALAHAPPAAAPAGEDVGALWREANTRLETSDYVGAIAALTRVYELVARDPEARVLRLRVRWALHEAHLGAHQIDGDAQHLYVARDLLRNGMDEFEPSDSELRARSEAALARLDAQLAELEAERVRAAEEARAAEAARAVEPAVVEPVAPAPIVVAPVPTAIDRPPSPRPMWIAAGATGAVAALGLGLTVGGFVGARRAIGVFEDEPENRARARDDIHRGNALGIAGSVILGVGVVTTLALVIVGLRRRQASRVASGGAGVAVRF